MHELKSHPWGCQGMLDVVVRLNSGDIRVMSVSDDIPPEHIPLKDKVLCVSKGLRWVPALLDDTFLLTMASVYGRLQEPLTMNNSGASHFTYFPIAELDLSSEWEEKDGFPEGYILQNGKMFSFKDYVMYKKVHRT